MRIVWITGQTGSGKTTMANRITGSKVIHLDGNDLRKVWKLGLSEKDRWEQNIRIANLAKLLKSQGFKVVVSTICPYRALRKKVQKITDCEFVYLKGGKKPSKEYPYEGEVVT